MTSPILPTEQRENEIEMREEEEEKQGGRRRGGGRRGVVQQINFISGLSTPLLKKKSRG